MVHLADVSLMLLLLQQGKLKNVCHSFPIPSSIIHKMSEHFYSPIYYIQFGAFTGFPNKEEVFSQTCKKEMVSNSDCISHSNLCNVDDISFDLEKFN